MAYIVSRSAVVPVEYDDPSSYYYMTLHVPYPPEFQAGDLLVAVFMWGNSNCPNVPGYTQLGYRETGVGAVVDQITFQWRIADGSESDSTLPIFSASIAGTEPDPPGRPALGFTMAIRNADTSVLADYRAPGDLNAFWWRAVGAIANATTPGATSPLAIPGLSPGPAPALFMTAGIIESWEQIVDPEYGISIPAKARFGATPYVGPATEQLVLQGSYQRSNVNDSANPADWKSYYAAGFWTGYSSGGDIPSGALYVDPNGDQEATAGACLFALKAGLCIKPFTVSGGAATVQGIRMAGETVSLAAPGVTIGSVSYPDAYTWQADASGITSSATFTATASGGQTAALTIVGPPPSLAPSVVAIGTTAEDPFFVTGRVPSYLEGDLTATATVAANLVLPILLAGQASSALTASADLSTPAKLAAGVSCSVSITADLTSLVTLEQTAIPYVSAIASPVTDDPLYVEGIVPPWAVLAADVIATAVAEGDLVTLTLAGSAISTLAAEGDLAAQAIHALAADVLCSVTASLNSGTHTFPAIPALLSAAEKLALIHGAKVDRTLSAGTRTALLERN